MAVQLYDLNSLRFANKKNSANLLSYQELHSQHDCAESCKLFHNLGKTKIRGGSV